MSLRHPAPVLNAASRYIDDRYSDFADARFDLSAYLKTCSAVRAAAERVLYRDVQLDFTGWKGRKHTKWPAASLFLLLRTLRDRSNLGRYIRAAALDYQLSTESKPLEDGLEEFLALTPNLKTLYLGQCPLALWTFPLLKITTFATTFAPGILPSILHHFPQLENLYLRDCHIMGFSLDLPKHNLRTVRLDSNHEYAAAHLLSALVLCSAAVEHLDIRFIGGLLHQSPVFAPRIKNMGPSPATNLLSLHLDNISVFSHLDSAYTQVLQSLTILEELHVSHHNCFSPEALTLLPPRLRRLVTSEYYGCWESTPGNQCHADRDTAFVVAFSVCITRSESKISRIVASSGFEYNNSLEPLLELCEDEKIECHVVEESMAFVKVFFEERSLETSV